jgi:tetratricopeptide (TPR) repeat protein
MSYDLPIRMRRLPPVFVFGLLGLVLAAAAPPPPSKTKTKVSAAVEKKYKAALSRGRKLEAGKDYPGAIRAFQAALALIPDDPWALSELGWAAFLAKDLTLAAESTRRAVAANGEPKQKAASLYNLAMIEEALGHNQAASKALVGSLDIRSTRAARAELVKVDPATAAAIDPFAPKPMKGPFASLAEFCKTVEVPPKGWSKEDCQCDWEKPIWDAAAAKAALAPPYQAARVFENNCVDDPEENLALKLKDGWYVAPEVGFRNWGGHCENEIDEPGLAWENGKRWLVLGTGQSSECWSNHEDWNSMWTTTWMTIVAIGPSGRPSATPRLATTNHQETNDEVNTDVALDVEFGDGVIEVKGKADKGDPFNVLGKHLLKFP